MNWISIGLAAASGALAAVITYLLVRRPKEQKVLFVGIFILSFVIINTLSQQYLLPQLNARRTQTDIDEPLEKIPAYQQIAKYDPDTYRQIKAEIQKSLGRGESEPQIEARIRTIVGGLVRKYLPRASDDAVVGYIDIIIQEIEELTNQSPDLCYRFLFPEQYGPIEARKHFKAETQKADLDALAKVIQTGAENSVAKEMSGYEPLVQKLVTNLKKVYGDDIALLKKPLEPGTDKEKFCKLTVAFYREALKLPKKESSLVLRYIVTGR